MIGPLKKPPRLRPGGTIGVGLLSGPVAPAALEAGRLALEGFGYRVRLPRNAGSRAGPLGLAGTDEERLAAYRDLLLDPSVDVIVLARGGYGIARLLPRLDPEEVGRSPKLHCGFSDGTALAAFLLSRCAVPSLHGPMAAAELSRGIDPLTARFFPAALEGRSPRALRVPDAEVLVPGRATGRLVGGCLSVLAALVGSPDEFDYEGGLLFLEEVNEEAYRVDRMLGTLARAGRFDKLAGVLIGSFSNVTFGGAEDPGRLREVLLDRFGPLGVPVGAGLPWGHRLPNIPLPVGGEATWDGASLTLAFEEDVVS